MKKSQNVDMFEKRKENAAKEKQKQKTRNIVIILVLVFVALGTLTLNMERLSHLPLSGDFPAQKEYEPNKLTVLQPRLYYSDGQEADQGTAFLMNYNGVVYAVTCTHFIDFNGPKVNKIELLNPLNNEVLFTLTQCVGKAKNISDSITADFIIMPIDMNSAELKNCNVVRLLKSQSYLGTNVFMPLKGEKKNLDAKAELVEPDFIMYSFRAWHTFSSESGSPLIRSHENILEGILARADAQNKNILSPPLNYLRYHLNNNQKFTKLSELY